MKILKLFMNLLLCIFLLTIIVVSIYYFFNEKDIIPTSKYKVKENKEKDYEAKLFMVGDALIHTTVYLDAKTNEGYDFTKQLKSIKDVSSKYDLAYYNQETILGGSQLGVSSYPRFNSPYEVGDAFIDAGFNLVSLATNHTMDKGEIGVINSVNYWKSKKDVVTSGQWNSFDDRNNSINTIHEVNNIKYAFLSYTIWNNGLVTPVGKEYLNNEYSLEKAKLDIEQIRDKVDFVIVAMHWGTEYSFSVDAKQEEIALELSNLGVDLIIGAHPHVIQTAEYINDNKTFVIYSLGNFISDQDDIDNFTGLAFEISLAKHVDKDKKVTNKVINPKAELLYTTTSKSRGYNSNFLVEFYPKLDDSKLNGYLNYYEKYKNIVNERIPNLEWGLTWE